MSVTFSFNGRMENNFSSYESIARLYQDSNPLFLDDLYLDFSNCGWFEANLSSPLGAVLNSVSSEINTIHLTSLPSGIEKILRKNEFLTFYGYATLNDTYGTCVKYRTFNPNETLFFKDYLNMELFSKQSLPNMSEGLTKKIKESIIEVFTNATAHSGTDRIFACGQLFPNYQRLDFTLTNLGRTFQENVSSFLKRPISDIDAIEWATQKNNSTRVGPIPGGLGLYTLLSFLQLNDGKVQIISGTGYWLFNSNGVTKHTMNYSFRGTIVNIEFNVSDRNSYALSTELDQTNIF